MVLEIVNSTADFNVAGTNRCGEKEKEKRNPGNAPKRHGVLRTPQGLLDTSALLLRCWGQQKRQPTRQLLGEPSAGA
jgi:hypothetical protein